jgi:hypothetical protein
MMHETAGYLWKGIVQSGFCCIPKLQIFSAAIRLAKDIGKHYSPVTISATLVHLDENSTDESAGSLSGKDEEKSNNDDESKDDSFRIVTSILFFPPPQTTCSR